MTTHPLSGDRVRSVAETPAKRREVTLPQDPVRLVDLFLGALLRGLDEGVPVLRDGAPVLRGAR